jgi:NAD+ synthase (glutamine-hydrolysing)
MDFGELGFYRVAAVQPPLRLADPLENARTIRDWAGRASERGACLVLFPELSVTGYTCEDLFLSQALLDQTEGALVRLARETRDLPCAVVVGAPWQTPDGRLYNCAFVLHQGQVRGAVPKTHLPNYGEFYERRWFVSGAQVDVPVAHDALGEFRLGTRQLFEVGRLTFAVELCEDLWAPVPPSGDHALAGANVLLNLSASNELVAKADYRRDLVRQQSARFHAGYVYVSCGPWESTKDVVFGGHAIVAEDGAILAEGKRFSLAGEMITADLDVQRLAHERARNITFGSAGTGQAQYRRERLGTAPPLPTLGRTLRKTPFVPDDPATVHERAREILLIQSTGLARRLEASRSETAVIGVSGGLDSTLALLVGVEAMRLLGRPPSKVLGVSMPGPGTTEQTRASASALSKRLGVTFREISIAKAVEQHFRDIGQEPTTYDVVYENSQARERTQILFDLANKHSGIVVGTGDLSELALGWCTYNGDHMANYSVNASVPKTLVQHLVRWYAGSTADSGTRDVLLEILSTTISPELLPPTAEGKIRQATEEVIGPYILHDFFLFHHVRNGFGPRKIFALAQVAFSGDERAGEIKRWLRVFIERFYRQQFKRTCLPPGPKVGSVTLSPRGDLRMPDEVDPGELLREVDSL